MSSLFARLSIAFFLILLTLGLTTVTISHRKSQDYFLEFTQRLNSPIAMYMAENANLLTDGKPDPEALARLAGHVMIINPSVEVYLLDPSGNVIAAGSDDQALAMQQVSLEPIKQFLQTPDAFPLFGDNPTDIAKQNIFSAFPLNDKSIDGSKNTHVGYVYAVLAGETHQSLLASMSGNYSFNSLIYTLAGVTALALLTGILLFFLLTKQLRHLTQQVRHWNKDIFSDRSSENVDSLRKRGDTRKLPDEIDTLKEAYTSMADRLLEQYRELERNDNNRRTFFANISHDLRTPLTTMQSYLETLILKENTLNDSERRNYIQTAHHQSERLRRLVMQLFELSKLDSGDITPDLEYFSILELAHDSCQYFAIQANSKDIRVSVSPQNDRHGNFEVNADIALLHRVFENLLSNALRYTPPGGEINVQLSRITSDQVEVVISDTGVGLPADQINRIFERRYRNLDDDLPIDAENGGDKFEKSNAGLGLSIVKSIVELHGSTIDVKSEGGLGTTFTFSLPASDLRAHAIAMS